MHKKAQGALEFLMTYGWAFLVILIMIGALAYFGVLNPSQWLPDRCNFPSQVTCNKDEFIINNVLSGTLTAELTNNYGSAMTITNGNVTTDAVNAGVCGGTMTLGGVDIVGTGNTTWNAGEKATLSLDCTAGTSLPEGQKVKFFVHFDAYPTTSSSSYAKQVDGEILGTVQ